MRTSCDGSGGGVRIDIVGSLWLLDVPALVEEGLVGGGGIDVSERIEFGVMLLELGNINFDRGDLFDEAGGATLAGLQECADGGRQFGTVDGRQRVKKVFLAWDCEKMRIECLDHGLYEVRLQERGVTGSDKGSSGLSREGIKTSEDSGKWSSVGDLVSSDHDVSWQWRKRLVLGNDNYDWGHRFR